MKTVAVSFTVAALALGVGGCSSSADVDACDLASDVVSSTDDASAVTDARRFATQFSRIEAPAEIEDEWKLFADYYSELAEALKDVGSADRDGFIAAIKSMNDVVDGEQMNAAGAAINDYASKNCQA